jgi:general stress protein CsbA
MQIRTVSAILVWATIALLLLNGYFRSVWMVFLAIGLIVIAVLAYFWTALKKRRRSA